MTPEKGARMEIGEAEKGAGASPLLSIKELRVCFGHEKGGEVAAVRGVDLCLFPGKTHALIGESGSGKSVTAHSILGLLPPPPHCRVSGSIRFQGRELQAASPKVLQGIRGNRIAMIFQEPMTSLNPLHRVGKQIEEMIRIHTPVAGRSRQHGSMEHRVITLLEQVGIPDAPRRMRAYPHELSGGQRQRVMIAMAIANRPDLLIADEPTTALDVTVQAQILALLSDLQKEMGMAVLLISHDLGVVRHVADHVSVMQDGEVVETGTVDALFHAPSHPCTRSLLSAENTSPPPVPPKGAKEMLCATNIQVSFPLKKNFLGRVKEAFHAVKGVSFCLKEGHTLGVVGESGSGKTSLGLAVLRLLGSTGSIRFDGKRLDGCKEGEIRPFRARMQVVFQDPFASLSPRMTVGAIVAEGLEIHKEGSPEEREEKVCRALSEVGLDPAVRFRYPHAFSGGQRQRIAIARVLVLEPSVIVFDEPTSSLDRSIQFQVISLLKELQTKHGFAYLFITHDLKVVRAVSHDMIVMEKGRVVETGKTAQVLDHPRHPYTKKLFSAAFEM